MLLKQLHIIYNNIRQNGIVYIKIEALFITQIISRADDLQNNNNNNNAN